MHEKENNRFTFFLLFILYIFAVTQEIYACETLNANHGQILRSRPEDLYKHTKKKSETKKKTLLIPFWLI